MEEKEEQEKKTKLPQAPKKAEPSFSRDSTHPPHCPNESEQTLPSRVNDVDNDNDVFTDTLRTLEMRRKARERKE